MTALGVQFPTSLGNQGLKHQMKCINLAAEQNLGLNITEGKSHMSVPVYEMLCKSCLRVKNQDMYLLMLSLVYLIGI
jgi:hypothetical protein